MAFINKLKSAVSNTASQIGNQAAGAAKQAAREMALPALILEKGAQLQKIDKELASLGWSASPEVKQKKAMLGQQRTQVKQELESLQGEARQLQDKHRDAQRKLMQNLR
ncbi:MAG: hypothetical protein JNJ54_17370 [Myxococcaceae bacterium]|nr:hypothetical protein [Myxococcaceae bacterium]